MSTHIFIVQSLVRQQKAAVERQAHEYSRRRPSADSMCGGRVQD